MIFLFFSGDLVGWVSLSMSAEGVHLVRAEVDEVGDVEDVEVEAITTKKEVMAEVGVRKGPHLTPQVQVKAVLKKKYYSKISAMAFVGAIYW